MTITSLSLYNIINLIFRLNTFTTIARYPFNLIFKSCLKFKSSFKFPFEVHRWEQHTKRYNFNFKLTKVCYEFVKDHKCWFFFKKLSICIDNPCRYKGDNPVMGLTCFWLSLVDRINTLLLVTFIIVNVLSSLMSHQCFFYWGGKYLNGQIYKKYLNGQISYIGREIR